MTTNKYFELKRNEFHVTTGAQSGAKRATKLRSKLVFFVNTIMKQWLQNGAGI